MACLAVEAEPGSSLQWGDQRLTFPLARTAVLLDQGERFEVATLCEYLLEYFFHFF